MEAQKEKSRMRRFTTFSIGTAFVVIMFLMDIGQYLVCEDCAGNIQRTVGLGIAMTISLVGYVYYVLYES